jgi:AcrR family transcriptional regulator
MPRSKELSESMRAATNQKILSAAIFLFSEKGFAATSVKEIAEMAGISVGLLYHYYKTKGDVFGELVQTAVAGLNEVENFFNGEPVFTIKAWAEEIISDISKGDEFVRFMHILSPTHVADDKFPGRTKLIEANITFQNSLAGLIERGQGSGAFREGDALGMAQFFLTMVGGMCSMKLALKDDFVLPSTTMMTAFLLKEEYNIYERG